MEDEIRPITVSVVNDYPVIVEGVARLLLTDPRFEVVEIATVVDPEVPVDVVLYDAFAARHQDADVRRLVADRRFTNVVVYTWHVDDAPVRATLELGVRGYLSKGLSAVELIAALVRVQRGELVIEPVPADQPIADGNWPGREEGLSPREAEVIALITQGTTNDDIAATCHLSINSVKWYIRSAYRKMGVERRSQAVVWGVRHGFLPAVKRDTDVTL